MKDNIKKAKENTFHKSSKVLKLPEVHGYDFDQGVDFPKIIASFATTGAQATSLSQAIDIITEMRKEKCTIYLGYTSNMVSSGLRDVFRYLAKHKMVDVIVTTAGGVEEDFIKCLAPFYLGAFESPGKELRAKGINRIGNIFVPNHHYEQFERFLTPILQRIADRQKQEGGSITPSELVALMGKEINNEESIYSWAAKNNIPVFCPAITDGSIGDIMYFFLHRRPEFTLDISRDNKRLNDLTMEAKKTGLIILGSGVVKHHILNTNMMRNGADYTVLLNNSQEFDASDAGARPDEAVSWGKILPKARTVKVFGDATILFPLIVASTFAKQSGKP
jgi:deoxyhypusine synthase